MFLRYSRWIGETLGSVEYVRSRGLPVRRVRRGAQRGRRVVHVGDQPDPVLLVQRARLGGDVRGRVVQPEERVQRVGLRLGHDLAVVVGVVAVDHHAVEAGEGADRLRRDVVELLEGRRPVEVAHRSPYRLIGVGERERPRTAGRLELDDQAGHRRVAGGGCALDDRAVQQGIDRNRVAVDVQRDLDRVAFAQVAEGTGGAGDRRGGRDAENGGQRPADCRLPVEAHQACEVLRHLLDDVVGVAHHDQHAPRLDAPGHVDRLALAVAHVDGRARWEEDDLRSGHAGTATGRHHAASAPNVSRAAVTITSASPPAATRSRTERRNACHIDPVSSP
jgi:hypothetical protein